MSQVLGAFGFAGFHQVTARSHSARVLKLMNRLFLQFYNFFFWRGSGKPRILNLPIQGPPVYDLIFTLFPNIYKTPNTVRFRH